MRIVILIFLFITTLSHADTDCPLSCQVDNLQKKVEQIEADIVYLKRHMTPRRTWF